MRIVVKFLLIAMLFVSVPVIAAFDGDTYDMPVQIWESKTDFAAIMTAFAMADSIGNYYSRAIYIGDCNTENAFCTAWTSSEANDDVNLLIEYSIDRQTWLPATINSGALFDDLNGGTVQSDTLNIIDASADALYHTAIYIRIVLDGQTSNPSETEVTVLLHFTKHAVTRVLSRNRRVKNRVE